MWFPRVVGGCAAVFPRRCKASTASVKPVKGMHDLVGLQQHNRRLQVLDAASAASKRCGYHPATTPILEATSMFNRAIGEETDIVSKEMFSFVDAGGASVTLRPEGTASVVRAVLSQKLPLHETQRLYYQGPMFRRERPQRGRYRQFVQFGVECIGSGHPHADVEAIVLGADILQMLGVLPATELRINTLCDEVTRATHRAALTDFLHAHDANLSAVSKRRLESGAVLRILDTKDKSDQALLKGAPTLLDHANPESIEKFEAVLEGLTQSGVEYTVDHSMVRGLDYYTGTVFEFVTTELGAQGAVLAGGRYDGLVSTLSAKHSAPAVGWAAGVERLELLMDELNVPTVEEPPQFWVVEAHAKANATSASVSSTSLWLAQRLRAVGHTVRHDHGTVLKKQLKAASQHGADVVFIVGEDEVAGGTVSVKNMATGEQVAMPLDTDWAQFL